MISSEKGDIFLVLDGSWKVATESLGREALVMALCTALLYFPLVRICKKNQYSIREQVKRISQIKVAPMKHINFQARNTTKLQKRPGKTYESHIRGSSSGSMYFSHVMKK